MVLMIDNYDSFTYNIVQYLAELGCRVKVFRNDKIGVEEVRRLSPERLVISPGPGGPQDAGISCDLVRDFFGKIPILGICLGHQCIGQVFGGKVVRAKSIMHGKTSLIYHRGKGVFKGLPNPFEATRYHSLAVEASSLPQCLEISARTKDGEIMGLTHKKYKVYGVQFHPESILTGCGKRLLKNFLSI
ncbi:MAG: aminodeoxychorismate/anthranilate synthase component II [Candidatus Omnitrophota bacterium]|jgi:anthranilate synthase/aminodeoxychorismate synthase-like glutamine amidotransferase